jgi:hypothetical protein
MCCAILCRARQKKAEKERSTEEKLRDLRREKEKKLVAGRGEWEYSGYFRIDQVCLCLPRSADLSYQALIGLMRAAGRRWVTLAC